MARNLTRERVEVPLHFEDVRLRTVIEAAGWVAAVVLTTLGISVAVNADGWMVEALGVVMAGSAGVAMVGLVRCRRFEIVVNRRFVSGRAGPLVDRLPLGMVDTTATRAATAWRRLYCHREAVLRGAGGVQTLILPSRDPQALIDAVRTAAESSG